MILAGYPLGIIDKMKVKKTGRGGGRGCFIFLELTTSSEGQIPLENVPSTSSEKINSASLFTHWGITRITIASMSPKKWTNSKTFIWKLGV